MCLKNTFSCVFLTFAIACTFVGVALITVGVLYSLPYLDLSTSLPSDYTYLLAVPIGLIALGSLVILISILGFCAVCKYSPCLLNTFSALLLVIFLAQIGVGVLGFLSVSNPKDLQQKIDTSLNGIFVDARDNNKTYQAYVIQERFQCCGRDGPDFWTKPPASCYREEIQDDQHLNKRSCVKTVADFLKDSIMKMAIIIVGLCVIALFSSILGFVLSHKAYVENRGDSFPFRADRRLVQ